MVEMSEQLSLFNEPKLRITKPVRLIELFAGIGAQAKALENLGVPFEHYRVCEIDKYAVKSYNAIHGTDFEPTDITRITGKDLCVTEKEKYCYVLTYSFPCQDLSKSGKGRGMRKGSGTRSGLLWEVERLLKEADELPQILIMENVPDVVTADGFSDWCEFLNSIGYTNRWEIMNANEYGVPQNRERCIMVSWLGNFMFDFPNSVPLQKNMRDLLEHTVDEKYYLKGEEIEKFINSHSVQVERERERAAGRSDAAGQTHLTESTHGMLSSCMCIGSYGDGGYEIQRRVYSTLGCCPTISTCQGGNREPKVLVYE